MVTDATTGQTFTSNYDIFTVGAGYLDLSAAVKSAQQVPAGVTAISPTANYNSTTGGVELSFDPSSVFSDKAMWGASSDSANKAMWGVSGTWSGAMLFGNKAMWGAGVDSANKAM